MQAGAVNVLHCICVSGYYCYHYNYYHYYCISTQATSIIKRALIGLACVAWAGNYVITGCARGTREGESRPPLLFSPHASSTFLLSPLPSPLPPRKKNKTTTTKKLAPAMQAMIGPTLERLCMGQCKEREWRGRTRGGGDKGLCVLHWFFYNELEGCARAGTYASSMAWCRTALNWSVALSYAHVLCARLFITWTTLITHPTLHFCTLYRHTKASRIVLAGNDARLFSALE